MLINVSKGASEMCITNTQREWSGTSAQGTRNAERILELHYHVIIGPAQGFDNSATNAFELGY